MSAPERSRQWNPFKAELFSTASQASWIVWVICVVLLVAFVGALVASAVRVIF